MRKILLCFLLLACLSCSKSSDTTVDNTETPANSSPCGTHNGKQLYKGSRGGCYYINSNGNKTYVDRNECNC